MMDKPPENEDGVKKLRELLIEANDSNDALDLRIILLGVDYWPDVLALICPEDYAAQAIFDGKFLRFKFYKWNKGLGKRVLKSVIVGVFRHPSDWWNAPKTKTPDAAYKHLLEQKDDYTAQRMERLVSAKAFEEDGNDKTFYMFASAKTAISSAPAPAPALAA